MIAVACFFAVTLLQGQNSELLKISRDTIFYNDGNLLVLPKSTSTDTISTFFLVRHAEKESGNNPDLTIQGKARALKLRDILKDAGITAIYSTDYKRTIGTAEPLSESQRIPISIYLSGGIDRVAKLFLLEHVGEKVLVVGHSNTTPDLINALIKEKALEHLADPDYGNLFVVTVASSGKTSLLKLRF